VLFVRFIALSKSQYEFSIKGGPVRGICEVAPKSGIELETKFLINCENFVDAHLPITYLIKATFPKPYNIPDAKNDLLGRTVYHGMESVIGGMDISDILFKSGPSPRAADRYRSADRSGFEITKCILVVATLTLWGCGWSILPMEESPSGTQTCSNLI